MFQEKTDLNFSEHKLAIEVDEKEHFERPKTNEEEREKNLKDQLGWKIIRISSDAETMMFLLKLVKYTITLLNQLKNL